MAWDSLLHGVACKFGWYVWSTCFGCVVNVFAYIYIHIYFNVPSVEESCSVSQFSPKCCRCVACTQGTALCTSSRNLPAVWRRRPHCVLHVGCEEGSCARENSSASWSRPGLFFFNGSRISYGGMFCLDLNVVYVRVRCFACSHARNEGDFDFGWDG